VPTPKSAAMKAPNDAGPFPARLKLPFDVMVTKRGGTPVADRACVNADVPPGEPRLRGAVRPEIAGLSRGRAPSCTRGVR
jgi:hypothetical protein